VHLGNVSKTWKPIINEQRNQVYNYRKIYFAFAKRKVWGENAVAREKILTELTI